jgi:polysaccharide chain length determinant protein (PEP-CTERM system associated)
MINPEKPFNVHDYLEILIRRIWFIVIPFVLILTASVLYAFYSPKEYRAKAMILVTPQKIPEGFVKPTITSKIEDRLSSIGQEIMSRASLEKIISEFKLYQDEIKTGNLEGAVDLMKKNIEIDIKGKEGYFSISYAGKDPRGVAMVTNKLTSLFTEENLKFREQQAQGTSEFLSTELDATKGKLDEQEKALMNFKRQFIGELPEQRDANLRVLEQLQTNYQRVNENMRATQDRKVVIQKQLSDLELMVASLTRRGDSRTGEASSQQSPHSLSAQLTQPLPQSQSRLEAQDSQPQPQEVQLVRLKDSLKELELKYTAKHPDIILTKKMIKDLEPLVEKARREREAERQKAQERSAQTGVSPLPPLGREGARENLDDRIDRQEIQRLSLRHQEMENQLIATNLEFERLKEEEAKVKVQIGKYRERIENTPAREQAITFLTRDYQNTKEAHASLLSKYEESRRAENLERRQKGEQFKVIEPAQIPTKPFKPDIPKILLFGLLLGLGGGLGIAFIVEQMDRSFRDASDIETTLGLKVIANIPKVKKEPALQNI